MTAQMENKEMSPLIAQINSNKSSQLSIGDLCESKELTRRRIIKENGRENIRQHGIPERSYRYMRDLATTLIELDWAYMLLVYFGSYVASYLIFAVICYAIAYFHGDLLFDAETGLRLGKGKQPCIIGDQGWVKMLIFSIETQTTNGYGELYPSGECVETIVVYILQILCSIAIEGAMVCLVYTKIARPTKQLNKLQFSDKAVICYRDARLCLVFRVCDPREQQTADTKIRACIIQNKIFTFSTAEGEKYQQSSELKLECNGRSLIAWPELICHVIDEFSPLRQLVNARQWNMAQFELYVSIVGTSTATAQITETRRSYMPREIFWGQRFVNVINYDKISEQYLVDYDKFNETISVDMLAKKKSI